MVVVMIVGIVAAFAVPNYTKSVERAHRKDAENNLILIHAAQQLYAARNNGSYMPSAAGNDALAQINANLGLNIIANGMIYTCPGGGVFFRCNAMRDGGTVFIITITADPLSATNPECSIPGTCP